MNGTRDRGQGAGDESLAASRRQPADAARVTCHLSPVTHHRQNAGVALIMAVFAMMVLAALGLMMASMHGTTASVSRGHYRVTQAFFIGDAGFSRGKEILDDDPDWRPSASNCTAMNMSHDTSSGQSYCRQTLTIGTSPNAISGHFDIFVDDLGGGDIDLRIRSAMDSTED